MAELSYGSKQKLPDRVFALPDQRKYPIEDKPHARNAKARASMEYHKGKLSKEDFDKVNAAADKVLAKK